MNVEPVIPIESLRRKEYIISELKFMVLSGARYTVCSISHKNAYSRINAMAKAIAVV